VSPVSRAWSKM